MANDVRGATAATLRTYVLKHVPVSSRIHVVGIGPISAAAIRPALEAGLGRIPRRPAARTLVEWDTNPRDFTAGWDLDARHYMEWYPLPEGGPSDRAGAVILAQLLSMRLNQESALRKRDIHALASADLVVPEGRFLKISANFRSAHDLDLLREVIGRILQQPLALPARGDPDRFLAGMARRISRLPDFTALRKLTASPEIQPFLEAQFALTQFNERITTGLFDDIRFHEAHDAVDRRLLKQLAVRSLRPELRSTLILSPRP